MLRRRSRGVARFSQHMLGHAIDFYIPGVRLEETPRHRPAAAARRRRLLSDFGIALRAHGYRRRADVAAHDAKPAPARFPGRPHGVSARQMAIRCRAMRWRSPTCSNRGQNPTATWMEEAREEGLDENIVLASDTGARASLRRILRRFYRHDAGGPRGRPQAAQRRKRSRTAAAAHWTLASAPATVAAMNPCSPAPLERARNADATIAAAAPAPSSNAAALYQTASYTPPPAGVAPHQSSCARLLPESVESASAAAVRRRKGDGVPHRIAACQRRRYDRRANRWPGALEDRVSPQLVLAYAAQTGQETPAATAAARIAARASWHKRICPSPGRHDDRGETHRRSGHRPDHRRGAPERVADQLRAYASTIRGSTP